MKGFSRDNQLLSLCGLNCGLCTMHLGGYCPGCGGGAGNQSCAIAKCSLEHGGVSFCYECGEYPCGRYDSFDEYDSFITHSRRQQDFMRAQEIGLSAYMSEQKDKIEILHYLLENFNDGRKKTLFSTVVYLLELADIQAVVSELQRQDGVMEMSVKERASLVGRLIQDKADERGICLKLRKKK